MTAINLQNQQIKNNTENSENPQSIDISQLNLLFNYVPTKDECLQHQIHYQTLYSNAYVYIQEYLKNKNIINCLLACEQLVKIISSTSHLEYLLLDAKPTIPKQIYIDCLFNMGTLLKNLVEDITNIRMEKMKLNEANLSPKEVIQRTLLPYEQTIFDKSLQYLNTILQIDFENHNATQQLISIYTYLTFFNQHDLIKCCEYLHQALFYDPSSYTIHYNLGFVHQKLNNLHNAIIHYKTSINVLVVIQKQQELTNDQTHIMINDYNGIANIYRSLKQWPTSLYYLLKALKIKPTDPDINNQLGVVYTEMRRTDLAENAYNNAIAHYKESFISTDPKFILSEIYLNFGHCHSYNGDNAKSIDCYNKSLQICPKFMLPFQNKLMNLNYIFDDLPDKMYITNQHKLINKLYKKDKLYISRSQKRKSDKINIGIISGDFVHHPVSFFINTFLSQYDSSKFNVTCYSEAIIDTQLFNSSLQFKTIKNLSQEKASQMIMTDEIDILIDLSGHTALNRLDIFSFKPAPIQITYLGYPFTTGLNEMDFRITDNICDDNSISQPFYTEKLIFLDNCFLCYDPHLIGDTSFTVPSITERKRNGILKIACFNRLNKITDNVIQVFNSILMENKNIHFVFKTKALLNKKIKQIFINKFNSDVHNRIEILECTLTHVQHLETYNEVDIAIDTFPYSGTTTTCESLLMGVPVFSVYDATYYFHPQNVSCSILKNSNLEEYICQNIEDLKSKIKNLSSQSDSFFNQLKKEINHKFLNGKVCNKELYLNNLQNMFIKVYHDQKKS